MTMFGQCENRNLKTDERCDELVMVLGISDVDHMGRQQLNTCQACSAKTAAFIARVEASFIEANAANPFYVDELRERQAATARRTRELNIDNDRRAVRRWTPGRAS
jgi:hypothetical protein